MKIKLLFLIGLTALFATGCLTPASKINAVQLGMSKAQVLKIMGTPSSITADKDAEYLNYALAEGMTWGSGSLAVATPYEIKIKDGKVESYGRAGFPNSPHPVPTPVIVPVVH